MTRTTPPRPASQTSTPTYPPPGEAPPNEPSVSDSLATAHTTAADEAAQAAADTVHHPTADYPYAEPSTGSAYHPEADVYAGTDVAAPEYVTPEESESVGIAPAADPDDGPRDGHRV
jgi:hypothetical protein